MSRIRHIQLFDANGDPIILNNGQLPVYMEDRGMFIKDSDNLDAFGRIRVSNPITIFDNQFNYNLNPRAFSNNLIDTGSITHLPNESAAELSTGGTNLGAAAILQTKRYMRYQPGKSQKVQMTATLGAAKTGVRQRIGYFDAANGLFFEQDETGIAVVQRSSTTGSPVDTRVAQIDWNIDPLDGTGSSGLILDLSKTQIFHIDFQYLGVGRVRFGFVIDGLLHYCHEFKNANNLDTVYMSTPHLPCRTEIENTGVAVSATTLKQYCISVISEGGFQEDISRPFAVNRGTASLGVTTRRPVLSIRPSLTFNGLPNRGHVIFREIEILAATNNALWEIVIGGTLTGAAWTAVDAANSITDYDTAATAIAGGVIVNSGWAISGLGSAIGRNQDETIIELFNDFAAVSPDIISLVCTAFTGTSNINALMRWTEQR